MRIQIFWAALLLLAGCGNNNESSRYTAEQIASLHLEHTQVLQEDNTAIKHLDLNPFLGKKEYCLDSLIKEVKLVALETTDKSLVGGSIYKIITTNEHIYILDSYKSKQSIIIFTKEGKFVKRFSEGQGPGELQRLYDIDFNFKTGELVAYQHSFLLFFDKEGNYLRQQRMPLGFFNFATTNDGYVIKILPRQGNAHLKDKEQYHFFFLNNDFAIEKVAVRQTTDPKALSTFSYICKNDTLMSLTTAYSDSVYRYNPQTKQLTTEFVLDYEPKLPKKYLYGKEWEVFDKAVRENNYYFNIGKYFETTGHNVFFLDNYYKNLATIVFRDKKSGNMVGGAYQIFYFKQLPAMSTPRGVAGDAFVSFCRGPENKEALNGSTLLSAADKEKLKVYQEDDNPILMYFTLKDF